MANRGIGVNKITVNDYFLNNYFFLPIYQREYKWENDNVETLINDIYSYEKYYIGNVMVNRSNDVELIDGQQRIISVYIILSAIKLINLTKKIGIKFEEKLLFNDKKFRISVDDRTSDQNTKIFNYIVNNVNPSNNIKKMNEYKRFKFVKGFLNKKDNDYIKQLYDNIKKCQLVEIDTHFSKIKPEQMFINLNAKGVKLSNDEMVRSIIVSKISSDNLDSFRNDWYNVFYNLTPSQKEDYLSTYVSIFETDKTTKIRKKDIVDSYNDIVIDSNVAKKTFDYLAGSDSIYLAAYKAVVLKETSDYIRLFNDASLKFSYLFSMLSFIQKIGFSQFNIALISILVFDSKNKNKIKNNFDLIVKFVKFVFLFATIQGLKNTSPSFYANDFVKFSVEMRDKSKLKENISKILSNFSVDKMKIENLDFLDDIEVRHSTKEIKYITTLISFLDDDSLCDYTGEHAIPQSSGKTLALSFGNVIPVTNDDFEDKDLDDKIKSYISRINSEKHLEIFLKQDYYNDYDKKVKNSDPIKKRNVRYKELLLTEYNNLVDGLKV